MIEEVAPSLKFAQNVGHRLVASIESCKHLFQLFGGWSQCISVACISFAVQVPQITTSSIELYFCVSMFAFPHCRSLGWNPFAGANLQWKYSYLLQILFRGRRRHKKLPPFETHCLRVCWRADGPDGCLAASPRPAPVEQPSRSPHKQCEGRPGFVRNHRLFCGTYQNISQLTIAWDWLWLLEQRSSTEFSWRETGQVREAGCSRPRHRTRPREHPQHHLVPFGSGESQLTSHPQLDPFHWRCSSPAWHTAAGHATGTSAHVLLPRSQRRRHQLHCQKQQWHTPKPAHHRRHGRRTAVPLQHGCWSAGWGGSFRDAGLEVLQADPLHPRW